MSDQGVEDALSALTHEVRVAILRELADAEEALSFTDLKERVDVRDAGRFNYHLGQLRDRFLRETDGGYDLTYRGESLLLAADPTPDVDGAALAPDGDCPVCGDPDCDRLIHLHLDTH